MGHSLLMLEQENKFSTPTALLATPEDKTLSCLRKLLRRKLLSHILLEDVTRKLLSHKSLTERMLCLLSVDVFQRRTSLMLLRTLSLPQNLDGTSKLFS